MYIVYIHVTSIDASTEQVSLEMDMYLHLYSSDKFGWETVTFELELSFKNSIYMYTYMYVIHSGILDTCKINLTVVNC